MVNKKLAKKLANLAPGGIVGHDGSGTGRPPNWLKAACDKALKDVKAIKFLKDTIDGKYDGRVVVDPETGFTTRFEGAKHSDKMRAVEMLMDRAHGKPSMSDDDKDAFKEIMFDVVSFKK